MLTKPNPGYRGAMKARLAAFALSLVLATTVATGCSPSPEPTHSEPTPVFTSEADAFAAAEATYRAYVDALNQVDLSDPETFEDVYAWTTGELNASDRRGLSEYHANGVSVTGISVPTLIEPTSAELDEERVILAVCLDVSAIDVSDAGGESLVDPGRTDMQVLEISLVGADYSPTTLLIESIGPREGGPSCS